MRTSSSSGAPRHRRSLVVRAESNLLLYGSSKVAPLADMTGRIIRCYPYLDAFFCRVPSLLLRWLAAFSSYFACLTAVACRRPASQSLQPLPVALLFGQAGWLNDTYDKDRSQAWSLEPLHYSIITVLS